jgi:hypothetical protein
MIRRWALGAVLAAAAAGCRSAGAFDADGRGALARAVIESWDSASRLAAAQALERYGPPDALAEDGIGWRGPGSWKRVVIRDGEGVRNTVSYRASPASLAALERFGLVEVAEDELSAQAGDERLNVLALNLADEVARGSRGPDEARALYDRILGLEAAGKSSPLLRSLRFKPD